MHSAKDINKYIKNLDTQDLQDIITVEHRSNNNKRDYLFVNRIQGKHIPTRPSEFIGMVDKLANKVEETTKNEKVLVIGFAETATALGNAIASKLSNCVYYTQTTRESIDLVSLVAFEEKHSHAVEQAIYSEHDISDIDFTYVLFVEDEISTGSTILNCISELERIIQPKRYGVASICNWQDKKSKDIFNNKSIDRYYLISGELIDKDIKMDILEDEIETLNKINRYKVKQSDSVRFISDNYKNERLGYYKYDTKPLVSVITSFIEHSIKVKDKVLILGTEEFMFIPMMIAYELEQNGIDVKCHANTRSSIDIIKNSKDCNKELVSKVELPSAYDSNRTTYLYNLSSYDKIYVITDASTYDLFLMKITEVFKSLGVDSANISLISLGKGEYR